MEPLYTVKNRLEIYKKVIASGIKTMDIVYRGSDARGPYNLPFMRVVSYLTKSPFTHAGIVFWMEDELFVLEMSDVGTMVYRFVDWLGFCIGGKGLVYTMPEMSIAHRAYGLTLIKGFMKTDPDYDFTFSSPSNYYCTELVCYFYRQVGLPVCEPKLIKEIISPLQFAVLRRLNFAYSRLTEGKVSLPMDEPMYFVGNEFNGGMMASPKMQKLAEW